MSDPVCRECNREPCVCGESETVRTMQIDGREVHVYHDGTGCRPMSALEVTLWKERNELAEALREATDMLYWIGASEELYAQMCQSRDEAQAQFRTILARLDAEKQA